MQLHRATALLEQFKYLAAGFTHAWKRLV